MPAIYEFWLPLANAYMISPDEASIPRVGYVVGLPARR